jgi:hypothetical protein
LVRIVSRGNRAKGVAAEREVAALFEAAGFEVRGLESGGDHWILGNGFVLHSEVKRHERLRIPEWTAQCEADASGLMIPLLSYRQSASSFQPAHPWRSIIRTGTLASLLSRVHD